MIDIIESYEDVCEPENGTHEIQIIHGWRDAR